MIAIGSVPVLRDLHHVKSKFGANVGFVVVSVGNFIAKLGSQFGELDCNDPIDDWVAHVVGRVVRQCSERESIFIDVM